MNRTFVSSVCVVFQAEDGIRYLVRSRGLGDVYKRQPPPSRRPKSRCATRTFAAPAPARSASMARRTCWACLLYTSDAADERSSVDLGGRRIIKKKKDASEGRQVTTGTKTKLIMN